MIIARRAISLLVFRPSVDRIESPCCVPKASGLKCRFTDSTIVSELASIMLYPSGLTSSIRPIRLWGNGSRAMLMKDAKATKSTTGLYPDLPVSLLESRCCGPAGCCNRSGWVDRIHLESPSRTAHVVTDPQRGGCLY